MIVKLLKNEAEDIMRVEVLMSGDLYGKVLYIDKHFFEENFESEDDRTKNETMSKRDLYKCSDKIYKKFKWWNHNIMEINFLYVSVYEKPIDKTSPYKLDMLNDIYDNVYKRLFKADHSVFFTEYHMFKNIFQVV